MCEYGCKCEGQKEGGDEAKDDDEREGLQIFAGATAKLGHGKKREHGCGGCADNGPASFGCATLCGVCGVG